MQVAHMAIAIEEEKASIRRCNIEERGVVSSNEAYHRGRPSESVRKGVNKACGGN
jgi:hypothetical protein